MSSETFTGGIPLAESEKQSIQIISSDNQEEKNKLPIQSETVPVETTTEEPVTFTGGEDVKITNLEKLEYGFDKTTQILGNVYRIGKAKVQDIIDDEKSFKDYILENEAARQKDIDKEHWKFATGKYDDDGIVKAAEVATLILDPGYILAYATPWGRAALKSYKMASLMGGITVSADVLLRDLATTGEINYGKVGVAGTAGAVLGPIAPAVTKIFSKYAPNATKQQVDEVVQAVNNKIAKNNNISTSQLNKIQAVAKDKTVIEANNALSKWTNSNFVAPVAKEISKVKNLEKTIQEKNKLLQNLNNLVKGTKKPKGQFSGVLKSKSFRQQIIDNKAQLKAANVKLESVKAEIYKAQVPKIKKYAELIANRNGKILEKLKEQDNAVDFAVKFLLSATVKPLVGGAVGLTGGVLFGDEDTKLLNWFIIGAAAGYTQKYIQRSKKFKLGDKNKILNIIDSDMAKYALQEVRALTSATSSSKLAAYGGPTEQVGKLLLQTIDDPVSQKSIVANADRLTREYHKKAYNLVKGFDATEQSQAVSIVRGKEITKDTSQRVIQLSNNIKNYLQEFKKLYNDSGFFSQTEIEDYFPRVFNWEKIKKEPKKFEETIESIFKSLKVKNPKKATETYLQGHKSGQDSIFNKDILSQIYGGKSVEGRKNFIYTPLSEHITQERMLNGKYKLVEEVLEKNGYLVNDVANILANMTNKSMRSIAFSRVFGENGQLLKPFFESIKKKYINSGLDVVKANKYAFKEAKLVADTVDAYFDRFGQSSNAIPKAAAVILSTLSNLNMLGRVTISSLGDLVQPFQNSSQFSSWFKALPFIGQRGIRTGITGKGETGIAKELNYGLTNEITSALSKPLATAKENVVLNNSWIGGGAAATTNRIAFKVLGLEWLTGFARRFAYNVGAGDIFGLSKSLGKVNASQGLNSKKALKIINDLDKYGVNTSQALSLTKFKNINEAIKDSSAKKILNQAGIVTANRDALIPQISNRLLFTQSRNEWARLMGQFMSWAMAKSTQTNKILQRIENGNVKTLVKTLAALPIYGGIQNLRELAKYGEITTDYGPNMKRWWAEAFRLSGQQGYLSDLFVNRTYGPGAREPWYLFAPSFQIATSIFNVGKKGLKGDGAGAWREFSQRLAPIPNWRRLIGKILNRQKVQGNIGTSGNLNYLLRNKGDLITKELSLVNDELKNNEKQNIDLIKEKKEKIKIGDNTKMNLKNTAKAALVAGAITIPTFAEGVPQKYPSDAGGVIIEEAKKIDKMEQEMEKAMANNIVPKNKPRISNLEPKKKEWLFDTAALTYKINKSNPELNPIMIAMNSEETGWGTSRFLKEGSNNLYNIQVFNKDEPHIKAKGSNAMVKKYKTKADSIKDFLNMVNNSPNYAGVRETIEAYKKGDATQGDIVDAIQATGWAENPKWADNVKAILGKRIEGKNKSELKQIFDKVNFVDKE